MEGIILAGGFGTRLRPRVHHVPKPMAPIAGKPFLYWLLDRLAQNQFRRVVLSVGYKKSTIIEDLGSRYANIDLAYAVEDLPLGTGGAIKHALKLLDPRLGIVCVMNGDTISTLRYREMYLAHATSAAQVTMALIRVANASRYGTVALRDHRVIGFAPRGKCGAGLINVGTYMIDPLVFTTAEWPDTFS